MASNELWEAVVMAVLPSIPSVHRPDSCPEVLALTGSSGLGPQLSTQGCRDSDVPQENHTWGGEE